MPVDYSRVDRIAAAVADIYREAETALLRTVTERLRAGHDQATDWQTGRLAQIANLRRAARHIVNQLDHTGGREVRAAVAAGYRAGNHDAVADLAHTAPDVGVAARIGPSPAAQRGALAVQTLADAAVHELRPVHSAILPEVESAYRQAIAGAAARRLTGAANTREAAQAAWARLTAQGITYVTDTRGRRRSLTSYVEMATRTAVARAALHGQTDRYEADGVRLVSVDDLPGECIRCRPYERQVIALWGLTGPQHVPSVVDGQLVEVNVVATLDQAMRAGFKHPNCRHNLNPYYPGRSILLRQGRTADPVGDEARQRQRAIERTIRYWREQETAALTDQARQRAAAKVRQWDTEIGRHAAQHKLTRKHHREQIGAGFVPPPGRVDDLAAELGIPRTIPLHHAT